MNYNNYDEDNYYHGTISYEEAELIVANKVRGSILWMVLGLLVTGVVGYLTFDYLFLRGLIRDYAQLKILLIVVSLLEVGAVMFFSLLSYKGKPSLLKGIFLLYSALTGVTLSVVGVAYSIETVLTAFITTLVLFVVLAIYGYTTKENLMKYTSLLTVGVISLVIMTIINIFLRNDGFSMFISVIGVIVFIIYIAYDVNRIKNEAINYALTEDITVLNRIEIVGALRLYLDFINLFIYILRILSSRSRD